MRRKLLKKHKAPIIAVIGKSTFELKSREEAKLRDNILKNIFKNQHRRMPSEVDREKLACFMSDKWIGQLINKKRNVEYDEETFQRIEKL